MHNLLRSTHRDQLPYTSSNYGDTWDALIALDNPNKIEEDSTVRLIYGDKLVPSVPYGKFCSHILCSYFMLISYAISSYVQLFNTIQTMEHVPIGTENTYGQDHTA